MTYPGYQISPDPSTGVGGWQAYLQTESTGDERSPDWVDEIIPSLTKISDAGSPPRILVLYGSLREPRAFSKFLAFEFARLYEGLGCDVRVFDPHGLPMRDPAVEDHPKVAELRALSEWSEGQMWVSPEMHGTMTGAFKNQIDWLPLNTGSVRPTQGRCCAVAQVNGGSQSFNVVNALRLLARWMRMPCCTNQSSVAKAWQEFDECGRMKDSGYRDRVVDVAEEFVKFVILMRSHSASLNDRYSERKERALNEGKLLTQAEKEVGASSKAA
eukprot:CAMPEP_0185749928 /NCGR_PEP_ID=MMETSP1174-20130828/8631_1 /TAXON_ID=35687 /ORGANISM="Dictyocha speculum, Strain CCMP1381" /LENGTH=270 /DNA_ID=CAMNT_0028426237 /DNA_START=182 /DNA_END=994 /DNA_ORIENTATION=+